MFNQALEWANFPLMVNSLSSKECFPIKVCFLNTRASFHNKVNGLSILNINNGNSKMDNFRSNLDNFHSNLDSSHCKMDNFHSKMDNFPSKMDSSHILDNLVSILGLGNLDNSILEWDKSKEKMVLLKMLLI